MTSEEKQVRDKDFRDLRALLLAAKDLPQRVNLLKAQVEYIARKHELTIEVHYDYPFFMINTPNFRLRVTINLCRFDDENADAFYFDVTLHFDDGYDNSTTLKYRFLADLDRLLRGYDA